MNVLALIRSLNKVVKGPNWTLFFFVVFEYAGAFDWILETGKDGYTDADGFL